MNLREFGQLVLVYPEVHIWTGTVTVDPDEDLKAVKDQLPPASLVSSGSKRLIDPERLTPLKSARKRLERAIEDRETRGRALGGRPPLPPTRRGNTPRLRSV